MEERLADNRKAEEADGGKRDWLIIGEQKGLLGKRDWLIIGEQKKLMEGRGTG